MQCYVQGINKNFRGECFILDVMLCIVPCVVHEHEH